MTEIDQRVLLRELPERGVERALLGGTSGHDHRLERRRREVVAIRLPTRRAEPVADTNVAESPELADVPGLDRTALDGLAAVEHCDRGDLPLVAALKPQSIACPYDPGEHPNVRNPLARRSALDLEHRPRDLSFDVTGLGREELGDARGQGFHTRARDRRSEEHRVRDASPGLRGELRAEPAIRQGVLVLYVRGEDGFVVIREQAGQLAGERDVSGSERLERGATCPALAH